MHKNGLADALGWLRAVKKGVDAPSLWSDHGHNARFSVEKDDLGPDCFLQHLFSVEISRNLLLQLTRIIE